MQLCVCVFLLIGISRQNVKRGVFASSSISTFQVNSKWRSNDCSLARKLTAKPLHAKKKKKSSEEDLDAEPPPVCSDVPSESTLNVVNLVAQWLRKVDMRSVRAFHPSNPHRIIIMSFPNIAVLEMNNSLHSLSLSLLSWVKTNLDYPVRFSLWLPWSISIMAYLFHAFLIWILGSFASHQGAQTLLSPRATKRGGGSKRKVHGLD